MTSGEAGFALIAVMLLVTVMLILSLVAFSESGYNLSNAVHVGAGGGADGSASAGIAWADYQIESENFPCGTNTATLPSAPNAGTDKYSVTVTYYNTLALSLPADACPQNGASTPAAALVLSTGTASLGDVSSSETIQQLLSLTANPGNYVLFSSSTLVPLDLSNIQISQPGGPANTTPSGQVYANDDVIGTNCPGPGYASIVAFGSLTLNNCKVSGSVTLDDDLLGNGALTLSQSSVGVDATTAAGDITMSHSTLGGSALADGNILMCPTGPLPPPSCVGLNNGTSTIAFNAASSTGTVTVGATTPAATCGGYTDPQSHDSVGGCVEPDDGTQIPTPPVFSLPTLYSPDNGGSQAQKNSYTAWHNSGGYAVDDNASCAGTGSGSVYNDIKTATGPTAIVANCALTLAAPDTNLPLNYNIAIFASGGFTLGGGFAFQNPGGAASCGNANNPNPCQLSLIVPTPTSVPACVLGSPGITIAQGGGGDIPNQNTVDTMLFTPCTVSVNDNLQMFGQIFAGTIAESIPPLPKGTINITFAQPVHPPTPGLVFGYQIAQLERYVCFRQLPPPGVGCTSG
ncbi:MAG TPA: hypothetical protein VMR97_01520 [Acidimicrobiales bacterium]|nr:hypothetical protein [Acidimicrobiales bacterium]